MFAKIGIIKIHMARHKTITRKKFILPFLLSTSDLSHIAQLSKYFLIWSLLFETLVECRPWRRSLSTLVQRVLKTGLLSASGAMYYTITILCGFEDTTDKM